MLVGGGGGGREGHNMTKTKTQKYEDKRQRKLRQKVKIEDGGEDNIDKNEKKQNNNCRMIKKKKS